MYDLPLNHVHTAAVRLLAGLLAVLALVAVAQLGAQALGLG